NRSISRTAATIYDPIPLRNRRPRAGGDPATFGARHWIAVPPTFAADAPCFPAFAGMTAYAVHPPSNREDRHQDRAAAFTRRRDGGGCPFAAAGAHHTRADPKR